MCMTAHYTYPEIFNRSFIMSSQKVTEWLNLLWFMLWGQKESLGIFTKKTHISLLGAFLQNIFLPLLAWTVGLYTILRINLHFQNMRALINELFIAFIYAFILLHIWCLLKSIRWLRCVMNILKNQVPTLKSLFLFWNIRVPIKLQCLLYHYS